VDSPESRKPGFRITPEALDSVYMCAIHNKFVFAVTHAVVIFVAEVYETIVAFPGVSMDNAILLDMALNDGLERLLGHIGDNLGIDKAVAFEDAKDDCFPKCTSATLPLHPTCTEVGLIHFGLCGEG